MNIFLSYSSKNRPKAEEIALALQAEGHEVFFDKDDLWGGEDFNAVIRRQIADADLFLFLISPDSVRQGAYSLSELRLAREKWPSPKKARFADAARIDGYRDYPRLSLLCAGGRTHNFSNPHHQCI